MLKKSLLIFILSTVFIGCYDENELIKPHKTSYIKKDYEPLEYLNKYRTKSELVEFKKNNILTKAAKNHAIYEAKNRHHGHNEDKNNKYFTGQNPQQRSLYAGYDSKMTSENISYRQDLISSIDSLFTAIYHRFGFLDFNKDEMGFFHAEDKNYSANVFVMGNSKLNEICKNGGDKNPRRFYKDICKNNSIKISEQNFKNAIKFENPSVVLFPSDGEMEAMNYFSGESPDPMSECKILSNPVSVSFSPSIKNIKMTSFKLFDKNEPIKDIKVLTYANDTNKRFSKNEFALFSLKPFEFGKSYKAIFEYSQGSLNEKLQWSFRTKEPENDYFYAKDKQSYAIKSDTYYDLFFVPKDCNDILEHYSYSSIAKVEFKQIGTNFLRIKASGFRGSRVEFTAKGKKIYFVLTSSSKNIKSYKYYGLVLLVLAFIVLLFKGKN